MGASGSPASAIPTLAEVLEHAQRGLEKTPGSATSMTLLREPLLHTSVSPDVYRRRASTSPTMESAHRCNHAASRLNTAIDTALAHAEVAAGASKSAQAATRPAIVEADHSARPESVAKQAAAAMVALDSAHLLHAAAAKAEEQAAASAKMASLEAFSVMQAAVERPREYDIEQGKAAGMMHNLDLVGVSRDQMILWGKHIRLLCTAHERLASRHAMAAMALNLTLVFLTASTSFLTSSLFEDRDALPAATQQQHYYVDFARRYAPGVLAGSAAVLAALQRAFGSAEKAEQHRMAAKRFGKLQTRYEDLKSSGAGPNLKSDGTPDENGSGWKEWLTEYLCAKDDAPAVGEAMWGTVERLVERQEETALRKRERETDKAHRQLKRQMELDLDLDMKRHSIWERKKKKNMSCESLTPLYEASVTSPSSGINTPQGGSRAGSIPLSGGATFC